MDAIKNETLKSVQGIKTKANETKSGRTTSTKYAQFNSAKVKIDCKYCTRKTKRRVQRSGKRAGLCSRKNHAKVCKSVQTHAVETEALYIGTIEQEVNVNTVTSTDEELYVTVEIQQQNIKLKLDNGDSCDVLPKYLYEKLISASKLTKTNTRLVSYSGNVMEVEGEVVLDTFCRGQKYSLRFYVVSQPTQATLGLKSCE